MPAGFEWCSLDVHDPVQLEEVYTLLTENYVEDDDNMFRYKATNHVNTAQHYTTPSLLPCCTERSQTNTIPVNFETDRRNKVTLYMFSIVMFCI